MGQLLLFKEKIKGGSPEGLEAINVSKLISRWLKRAFDIIAACFGLIFLSPFFVLITVMIKRDSPGPSFFWCQRMGMNGRPFRMLKFRTMYERLSSYQGLPVTCEGDERITPIGQWLRDTKINELPQLWNVLRGEMSLVGPRPEDIGIAQEWPEDIRSEILSVRPGVTSPASIHYHDEEHLLSRINVMGEYFQNILPDKLRLDQLYVRNQSFSSDLDVIFWTLVIVIPRLATKEIPEGYLFAGPITRFVHRYASWFLIDLLTSLSIVWVISFLWRVQMPLNWGTDHLAILAIVLALTFSGVNSISGLNRIVWPRATVEDGMSLLLSGSFVSLLFLIINYLQSIFVWYSIPSLPILLVLAISAMTLLGSVLVRYRWRVVTAIASRWLTWRHHALGGGEKVLIVGSGEGFQTANWLLRREELRYIFSIVGVVDDNIPRHLGMSIGGCLVLGSIKDIPKLVEKYDVGVILFAIPTIPEKINEILLNISQHRNLRIAFIHQMVKMLSQQLTLPVKALNYPCGSEDYAKFMALHDHVTGLPNRFLFKEKLLHSFAYSRRYHTKSAVLYMHIAALEEFANLDGTKIYDEVLDKLSTRLLSSKRESDTLAYLGGEEFGLIMENVGDNDAVGLVARRIHHLISEPMVINGKPLTLHPLISVCGDIDDCSQYTNLDDNEIEAFLDQRTPVIVPN